MATVFFKVTNEQDKEIRQMMNDEGYSNKSEFFRFLLKFFKYTRHTKKNRFEEAVDALAESIKRLDAKGAFRNLPSAREQLADV